MPIIDDIDCIDPELASESFLIDASFDHMRLDIALHKKFPQHSRTYFQFLIESQAIRINRKCVKKRELVKQGDLLEIHFISKEALSCEGENIPLDILYEDAHLIAINKPRNLVVHPAPGHPNQTIVNAIVYHFKEFSKWGDCLRPGIVHRLDKDTSGVLLIAKSPKIHETLSAMFADRTIHKTYLAICFGHPKILKIEGSIARDQKNRQKMTISQEGKKAITEVQILASYQGISLVKLTPLTGRTHQLRVHMHSIGCPIVGDPIYGNISMNEKYGYQEQLLHASSLLLKHPETQKELLIEAPLPLDMLNAMKRLNLSLD